jgi:phosphatidylserine/phosphatidylglycerophosphate/cardiolipin synthase-like enzyme
VSVILDASQKSGKYSSADFLRNAGVPTAIDSRHAIAHNKVMVMDGAIVLTGSFNFTKNAEENNAENLLVIQDAALALRYSTNWTNHLSHSVPYKP